MPLARAKNELYWCRRIAALLDSFHDVVVYQYRERQLWDRTRIDILTDKWAFEVDWAYKFAEAVGQAQWYGLNSSRQPGIILLVKDRNDDAKYIYRCRAVCVALNMPLWLLYTDDEILDIDTFRYPLLPEEE